MRIAFLSTFYPFRGGIAQFNANLYEAAREAGHEVKAFTFTCQYPKILFPGKTQYVTERDTPKIIDSEEILNTANPLTWGRTARRIAAWKPDVVVMKYWMSYLAPSLGSVARKLRKRGIKVIAVLDNVIPHEARFFDKPFSRWFLRSLSACVAMSRAVLSDKEALAPEVPSILVPHPLYDHFGARLERDESARMLGLNPALKTLLYFGLIRDYKGLDLLIEAMSHLDESYQLLAAGESYGGFERYEQLAAGNPRIHLQNRYIGDDEVPLYFSAADLCVLPYRSATQSGITAIALHFDLPLAATPVGGLPESIGEPGVGVMAREVSPEAIAEAIRSYFEGKQQGCREAITAFKQTATWQHFSEEVVLLAERI